MDPDGNPAGVMPSHLGPASPDLSAPSEHKKRNRIRFSCTNCRQKKLKCNRQSPCDQCLKRDIGAECQIIPYETRSERPNHTATGRFASSQPSASAPTSRSRSQISDPGLQARLKHLERLVHVLKAQRRESVEDANEDALPVEVVKNAAKAGLSPGDQRYLDPANWEAIVDDLAILTRDMKTAEGSPDSDDDDVPAVQAPILLAGGFPRVSIAEMITLLPPRSLVDRLIARFFEAKEAAWAMFHVPTFMKNYKDFWDKPLDTNYTWLGLLFVMCCHAALYLDLSGQELPGDYGSAALAFNEYNYHAAQCLALADYAKPGCYKVQAMLLHFGCEYLRRHDFILGTSTLLTITIRLAVHMGLHRDPKHYPGMSPFEGEMRRRMWALLVEIDLAVSSQFGVPCNTHPSWYDTEPPRNLHDEDFDEDTKELPPSRPETERTVSLIPIVRGRLMDALAAILAATTSASVGKPISYAEVMRIDKQLEDAHSKIPPVFRYRPFSHSLVDPVEVIMGRYWLDLMYQKCRILLHRKYLCVARKEPRYEYSRRACLDAATQMLRHQFDMHNEMQPGARLSKDRWFLSSLTVHGFLLADMVLCLELAYLKAKDKAPEASDRALEAFSTDTTPDVLPKQQVVDILRTSRSIWKATRKESHEKNRAFKILSDMLAMSAGSDAGSSPESTGSSGGVHNHLGPEVMSNRASSSMVAPKIDSSSGSSAWTPLPGAGSSGNILPLSWDFNVPLIEMADVPPLESLEGLLETDSYANEWMLFDNQIQNNGLDTSQIPWGSFFPQ